MVLGVLAFAVSLPARSVPPENQWGSWGVGYEDEVLQETFTPFTWVGPRTLRVGEGPPAGTATFQLPRPQALRQVTAVAVPQLTYRSCPDLPRGATPLPDGTAIVLPETGPLLIPHAEGPLNLALVPIEVACGIEPAAALERWKWDGVQRPEAHVAIPTTFVLRSLEDVKRIGGGPPQLLANDFEKQWVVLTPSFVYRGWHPVTLGPERFHRLDVLRLPLPIREETCERAVACVTEEDAERSRAAGTPGCTRQWVEGRRLRPWAGKLVELAANASVRPWVIAYEEFDAPPARPPRHPESPPAKIRVAPESAPPDHPPCGPFTLRTFGSRADVERALGPRPELADVDFSRARVVTLAEPPCPDCTVEKSSPPFRADGDRAVLDLQLPTAFEVRDPNKGCGYQGPGLPICDPAVGPPISVPVGVDSRSTRVLYVVPRTPETIVPRFVVPSAAGRPQPAPSHRKER